jgi:hypothetical protein
MAKTAQISTWLAFLAQRISLKNHSASAQLGKLPPFYAGLEIRSEGQRSTSSANAFRTDPLAASVTEENAGAPEPEHDFDHPAMIQIFDFCMISTCDADPRAGPAGSRAAR